MNAFHRRITRSTALATIAGGLATASLPLPARAAVSTLRIATLPLDTGAQCYYAQDEGFFRDAGLDARIQSISNGAAIVAAVVSGSVEVGFSNLPSVAAAYKHGVPITIVAPGGLDLQSTPTSGLVLPANSTVRSASDLNGKTIAVNGIRNITQIAAQAWIDKDGGDSSTVHFVEMPFPTMIEALSANRVDGAVVVEPFVAEARKAGRFFADAFAAIGSRILIGCWITTTSWANANAALVADFAKVMARTANWANSHQQQSGLILAKYGQLEAATVRGMKRAVYASRFQTGEMQPVIDVCARYGAVPETFPASDLIYKT